MADVTVPWGSEELTFSLPESWSRLDLAGPQLRPAPEDWPVQFARAMHQPISGPSLADRLAKVRKGRVCVVVEDLTRHSPLEKILELLWKEIRHAGIDNSQVEIVVGAGMHPPCDPAEMQAKLGPAVEGVAWRWNPWDDIRQYLRVGRHGHLNVHIDRGVCEADLRILITSVSPHLQAGFGGGYKMLFPGCAEISSIRRLHRTGIRRGRSKQLVGMDPDRNPMRQVIDAAGRMVDAHHGETFTVQYLLDADDQPTYIAAGEPMQTHRLLTKQCALACGILQNQRADVVITNAHPRDHDLWQCFKCIPNTCWGAREGGAVICLARCPAGLNEMEQMSWPFSPRATRRIVRWIGPDNLCSLVDPIVRKLAGDSQWFIRMATQILHRGPIYMVSPILTEQGVTFPGMTVCATVEEAIDDVRRHLEKDSAQVAVYPSGGISYPVLGK
jgi:nickel-dependent lactate racemase